MTVLSHFLFHLCWFEHELKHENNPIHNLLRIEFKENECTRIQIMEMIYKKMHKKEKNPWLAISSSFNPFF